LDLNTPRAVQDSGNRRQGEAGLQEREKRVEGFAIRPLAPTDRERHVASWLKVQAQFVDDPKSSVTHADQLLGDVMSTRGYSVSEFEQRAADISVNHPLVVENYRAAMKSQSAMRVAKPARKTYARQ
jgi:hypothetical protein